MVATATETMTVETAVPEVVLAELSRDMFVYNSWANAELVAWLRTKPTELLEQHVPSSFPSLKSTLLHIWHTQDWWLGIMQQRDAGSGFDKEFSGTNDELFDGLLRQSEQLVEHAWQLFDSDLQQYCEFVIPYVGAFSRPVFEMVQHCTNHSTYHRGQLVSIARNLGCTDAPMTDYMFYLLMVKHNENPVRQYMA